jgi:hypothetical protein
MAEQSRIKFNPITKEIEIEGSEKFVKTYFDKIQSLLLGTREEAAKMLIKQEPVKAIKEKPVKMKAAKEKPVKKARQSKKAQKVITEIKRGDISKAVIALIQDSPEGITTAEIKEKTGLTEKQIWAISSNAKKAGKIKQAKRGVYVGA